MCEQNNNGDRWNLKTRTKLCFSGSLFPVHSILLTTYSRVKTKNRFKLQTMISVSNHMTFAPAKQHGRQVLSAKRPRRSKPSTNAAVFKFGAKEEACSPCTSVPSKPSTNAAVFKFGAKEEACSPCTSVPSKPSTNAAVFTFGAKEEACSPCTSVPSKLSPNAAVFTFGAKQDASPYTFGSTSASLSKRGRMASEGEKHYLANFGSIATTASNHTRSAQTSGGGSASSGVEQWPRGFSVGSFAPFPFSRGENKFTAQKTTHDILSDYDYHISQLKRIVKSTDTEVGDVRARLPVVENQIKNQKKEIESLVGLTKEQGAMIKEQGAMIKEQGEAVKVQDVMIKELKKLIIKSEDNGGKKASGFRNFLSIDTGSHFNHSRRIR
jgi:hypothetical protein